jgi:hypothetical protein
MKKVYLFFISSLVFFLFYGSNLTANVNLPVKNRLSTSDTVTVSFSVSGTGACKSNIESAVTATSGVISASWDSLAKNITVTFIYPTVHKHTLYVALANAGYDNAELRAKDAVYATLPQACQYQRNPPTE